ncbi:MAG: hypothetical protein JSU90_07385 [Nitrospiraceae bacterium]|nr:MAG: hypothetical protein JSU90_07385 [Nitrospiraceae bacterium]
MADHRVTIFRPYPFAAGQKIRIEGTRRRGDWEVLKVSENKVTLRCPVSYREFEWDIFCYAAEEQDHAPWPLKQSE